MRWRLRRSLDLVNWSNTFTSDGNTHQPASGFAFGFSVFPHSLFLIDETTVPFSKLFFKVETELIP